VYDLRHPAARLLIREGASVKVVQHRLGHAAASTLDTYGYLSPDELDALAGCLEDLHGLGAGGAAGCRGVAHGGPAVVALGERAG
jgi:Phage integrase family